MTIGIIVAMDKEMALLRNIINDPVEEHAAGKTFICGSVGDTRVVAMQCGIGKVNAAIGGTLLITHYSPDAVINTGVAGAGDARMAVGDVVVYDDHVIMVFVGEGFEADLEGGRIFDEEKFDFFARKIKHFATTKRGFDFFERFDKVLWVGFWQDFLAESEGARSVERVINAFEF